MIESDPDLKWDEYLLPALIGLTGPRPPDKPGIYYIQGPDERILYVGTSKSLIGRIGSLVTALMGFHSDDKKSEYSAHHGGGLRIREQLSTEMLSSLEIGWSTVPCRRCAERKLYDEFDPPFNSQTPPTCKDHSSQ